MFITDNTSIGRRVPAVKRSMVFVPGATFSLLRPESFYRHGAAELAIFSCGLRCKWRSVPRIVDEVAGKIGLEEFATNFGRQQNVTPRFRRYSEHGSPTVPKGLRSTSAYYHSPFAHPQTTEGAVTTTSAHLNSATEERIYQKVLWAHTSPF